MANSQQCASGYTPIQIKSGDTIANLCTYYCGNTNYNCQSGATYSNGGALNVYTLAIGSWVCLPCSGANSGAYYGGNTGAYYGGNTGAYYGGSTGCSQYLPSGQACGIL